MKNPQKISNAALMIIIALLVIGGSLYIYQNKKGEVGVTPAGFETLAEKDTPANAVINTEKTYTNIKHGFEFKYPSHWSQQDIGVDGGDDPYRFGIFQTTQSPSIPKNGLYGPSISFWVSDFVVGPSGALEARDSYVKEVSKDREYEWLKIDGSNTVRTEKSLKTDQLNTTNINYHIFKGDKVYKFDFTHDNNNPTLIRYESEFETIVSTIKFIR